MTTVVPVDCDTARVETPDLTPRKAEAMVAEALGDTRVVTLNGARQAGKSTLARLAARTPAELDGPAA